MLSKLKINIMGEKAIARHLLEFEKRKAKKEEEYLTLTVQEKAKAVEKYIKSLNLRILVFKDMFTKNSRGITFVLQLLLDWHLTL